MTDLETRECANVAEPRKVSDAQREAMRLALIKWDEGEEGYESVIPVLCAIIESPADAEATT